MARVARTSGLLAVSVEVPDENLLAQDFYRWTYRCRARCGGVYPVTRDRLTLALVAFDARGLGMIYLSDLTRA